MILIIILIAQVIPISYSEREGNIIAEVQTNLLGELIFYSPWILGLYIIIATCLILYGLKKKRKRS